MQDLPLRKEEFLSKIITFNLCFERESRQIATCHVMSTMLTNLHSIVNCLLLHVTMRWNFFWNSILFMIFYVQAPLSFHEICTKVVAVWRASSKQHHHFSKELPYWDNPTSYLHFDILEFEELARKNPVQTRNKIEFIKLNIVKNQVQIDLGNCLPLGCQTASLLLVKYSCHG